MAPSNKQKALTGGRMGIVQLVSSMLIFGTVGVVRRYVGTPSAFTAAMRGLIGAAMILAVMLIARRKPSFSAIKNNLLLLIVSGAFIGINWILLFEAYRFTTVALATLCYYMAPVFVIIASPLVLRTRVGVVRWVCVSAAFCGMILVSEPWQGDFLSGDSFIGVLLATGAALFYAAVTLLNKRMRDISSYDTTLVQLLCAAVTVLPYSFIAEEVDGDMFGIRTVILLIVLGVVHTGLAYVLYFGSVRYLSAPTVAIFGYIDPIFAVLLSALLLGEEMSVYTAIGAVLILASTMAAELIPYIKSKRSN